MEKSTFFIILFLVANPMILCLSKSNDFTVCEKPYYPKLKFTLSLLNSLQKNSAGEDVFYSPQSVYRGLLLTYFCAAGETKRELENVLCLSDWVKSKKAAHKWDKNVQIQDETTKYISINKLYVSNQINVTKSVKQLFGDRIEQLNFSNKPAESIDHINQFVGEMTKNNIKCPLQLNETTRGTDLALVTAAYFKGAWVTHFDGHRTRCTFFYKNGVKPISVYMMSVYFGSFKHGVIKDLKTQVLQMPYKGSNERFSMYIFLPENTTTAIDELLGKLTAATLDDVFNGVNMRLKLATVEMPRFSMETQSEIAPALEHLGVRTLFDGAANFGDLIDSKGDFIPYETKLAHISKLQVDEYGSFAPTDFAPNDVDYFLIAPEIYFICDYPFMYLIHDDKSKEILFAGVYRAPKVQHF